jgi:hypothetical protein
VKLDGPFPFHGVVVWLTAEQGGRSSGPPVATDLSDYAATAFVPPSTVSTGLASFVLRGFVAGAWRSRAEGRWLVVENRDEYRVVPGTVVAVTEGPRVVGFFAVDEVA